MRVILLAISGVATFIVGLFLAAFLWFSAAQNASMSRSAGPASAEYARTAQVMYWAAFASVLIGSLGSGYLLLRAKRLDDEDA